MKYAFILLGLLMPSFAFSQTPGIDGVKEVRRCVMDNDPAYCHSVMTPESKPLFDKFVSYKLMPCLPTDFTYVSEEAKGSRTIAKLSMPAGNNQIYLLRLVFAATPGGPKFDIPATFERGLGNDWQNQINLSEQLYLMMRQNMGDKLTCDMLNDLIRKN